MEVIKLKHPKLSKTVIGLIQIAIDNTKSNNRYTICEEMAQMLEEKYIGYNFDYQTKRMNVDTTKKILNAIDLYFLRYVS